MKGMVHMINKLKENIGSVFVGKENVIDLLLVSLLADGHVLLEDVPGTGKTLLAKTISKVLVVVFLAFNLPLMYFQVM